MHGRGPLGAGAPDPAAQPAPRRGGRRRRERADEGRLVQPGLSCRAPAARARGCCSTASSTARAFAVATHEIVAGGRRRRRAAGHPHDRDRPGPQRHARGCRPNRLREWAWQAIDAAPPTRSSRCRRELRARRRLAGRGRRAALRPLPRLARAGRRARATGSPSRSSACTRRRWRCAAARGATSRPGIAIEPAGELVAGWLDSLPFEPTDGPAARRSTRSTPTSPRGRPMQRLLMGEVGSGKTVVAVYAMLRALEAGHQAALMAPTETLAEQHAATLDALLRRARRSRSRCSPARPRRRAGARRSTGWRPASSGSSSAPTR